MHREIQWLLTTQLRLAHLTSSFSSSTLGCSLRLGHFRFDTIELTNLHMFRCMYLPDVVLAFQLGARLSHCERESY